MVERIVHQLEQANENLTGNVFEAYLKADKVKEHICMPENLKEDAVKLQWVQGHSNFHLLFKKKKREFAIYCIFELTSASRRYSHTT